MFPLKDENPSSIFPIITWSLIIVNASIFLWEMLTPLYPEQIFYTYGFVPKNGIGFGLLSSMFLHGSILHLGGNVLFLYIFGDNVEDACGHFPFIFFYIICGVGAALLLMLLDPYSTTPVIGASGAISGVLGGYVLLYPTARVRTAVLSFGFIQLVYFPAIILIGFWFLLQLGYAFIGIHTGVAYWAHVGGFLAGLVLIRLFTTRKRF